MIFVDTNVVLRWLLDDHQVQSAQVRGMVKEADDNLYLVTDVILAEIYYVLRKKQHSNQQIAEVVNRLLEQPAYIFDNETILTRQVEVISETHLDFADCYLISRAIYAGQPLETFDKAMRKAYEKYKAIS